MASNHIHRLQDELVSKDAEIDGLREGLSDLIAYLTSDKFASDTSVNVTDVLLRLREAENLALTRRDEAAFNEAGPGPEASVNGWRCPKCREALQDSPIWNDTDARAAGRMRDHWRATHRVTAEA